MMKWVFRAVLVAAVGVVAPSPVAAQSATTWHPAAVSQDLTLVLTNGWAALAEGNVARAEERAAQARRLSPRGPAVFSLLLEIGIARGGLWGGMAAYDDWVGTRADEPLAVRRLGQALLYERAFAVDDLHSVTALLVLADAGDERAARQMESDSVNGSEATARLMAARGYPPAIDRLVAALKQPNARHAVLLDALGKSGSASAADAIRPFLQDPRTDVRGAAVRAYGLTAGASAADHLVPMLADPSVYVRFWAAAGLFRVGNTAGNAALDELAQSANPADRLAAAEVLILRPDARSEALIRGLLNETDTDIRLSAAQLAATFDAGLANRVIVGLAAGGAAGAHIQGEARKGSLAFLGPDLRTLRRFLVDADPIIAIEAARLILLHTN